MDHLGTLAPAGAPPHLLGRRLEAAVVKRVAVVWGGSALPIVVTATGVIVLALDLAGGSVGLRLAVVAIVLAASLAEATRLRDRNRLIESERVATDRLVETEAWRRMLIERLPAAVYLDRYRRADGAFLESAYMSPQMEELTGYPIDSFLVDAELWPMMVHPDDRERFRAFDIPGPRPTVCSSCCGNPSSSKASIALPWRASGSPSPERRRPRRTASFATPTRRCTGPRRAAATGGSCSSPRPGPRRSPSKANHCNAPGALGGRFVQVWRRRPDSNR
jgi:PAS domain-containing protein